MEALIGSAHKEKVLVFLVARKSGYARQISDYFMIPLTPVIKHLKTLEEGHILYAEMQGRTKVYKFNPSFPFINELKQLLKKVLRSYPDEIIEELTHNKRN